jgi:hypothetical protein
MNPSSFASLPLWLACLPAGLYLLGIATLHLRRRPVAVTGLAIAGPLELLQPVAVRGPWRLLLPAVLLALLVALAVLAARPRLVVYNISLDQLRPVVAEIASGIDAGARWAGETVALPGRDVQVHLDGRGGMRSVSLVAIGSRTSPEAWSEFSRRVRRAVRGLRVRRSPWGAVLAVLGLAVLAGSLWIALRPVGPAPHPSNDPPSTPGVSHAGSRRPVAA